MSHMTTRKGLSPNPRFPLSPLSIFSCQSSVFLCNGAGVFGETVASGLIN